MDQLELAAKTIAHVTPKHQYISLRSYPSEQERKIATDMQGRSWVHMRPRSVLIASMGNHWYPTSWQKTVDMLQYCTGQGTYVALQEIQDRCLDPYDALGTMRNEAILQAISEGFEYLMYVDNDILPQPDTLFKLLQWDMPVVAPLIYEPTNVPNPQMPKGKQLSGPPVEQGKGLVPAKWSVLSMLLFKTAVFNCFADPGHFWSDAIGADEGFHFQKLWTKGHRVFIDTNTELKVGKEPTYPLAVNRFSMEERRKFWDDKIVKMLDAPNRRPIDPYGPGVIDGDYMPFVPPGTPSLNGAQPVTAMVSTATNLGWAADGSSSIAIPEIKKEEVKTYGWAS